MHGTWKTTGGGGGDGGGILAALVFCAVVIGGAGVAAGIAQGVAESVHALLIIFAGLVVVVAGLTCLVAWKVRHSARVVMFSRGGRQELESQAAALKASMKPAIASPSVTNVFMGGNHVHGMSGAGVPVVRGDVAQEENHTRVVPAIPE
jgi:hypothetical protein